MILPFIDVETWSIADVGEWLQSIRLDTYAASFAVNEISGQVLLDISLDDLDYMDVTILGHRKLILKGIEDLRKNKRVTIQVCVFCYSFIHFQFLHLSSVGVMSTQGLPCFATRLYRIIAAICRSFTSAGITENTCP